MKSIICDSDGRVVRVGDWVELVHGVFVRGKYLTRLVFVRVCRYGLVHFQRSREDVRPVYVNILGDFPFRVVA